jgi:hypothetical protein
MPYLCQCTISLQDCEALWPLIPGYPCQRVLPWVNGSCPGREVVRDGQLVWLAGRTL